MILKISGLELPLGERESQLQSRVATLLGVPAGTISDLRVIRRSIDARRTRPPRFVYLLAVRLADGVVWRPAPERETAGVSVVELAEGTEMPPRPSGTPPVFGQRPVVAGAGPAGLFAALTLALRGIPVLLLERGRPVQERVADVRAFWERGQLNPESNVHFGEGGAGTFSDGKLTCRVKNPRTPWVKQLLVEMGAPSDILVDARPHIGTDRLREVVVRLRKRLVALGAEVRFGACVTDLLVRDGRLRGVVVNRSEEIPTSHLVLATGQSAADTYRALLGRGVRLTPKPFAIGLRVEHPQRLIDRIQYGRWADHPALPPADYFLTARVGSPDRSCYSFCMCPGGEVIGCSAEAGGVITNGMSRLRRDSPFANSAVVVNVRCDDFAAEGPLAGLDFRRRWEERAFVAGGGDYWAPAQRLTDFLAGRGAASLAESSFRPGIRAADLREVLPPFVVQGLRQGLGEFERKMPGFVTAEATLIGVETRTSSPVRIPRGEDGQGENLAGLYPCGEGAGYAGGIVSSALDGIRAAERLLAAG